MHRIRRIRDLFPAWEMPSDPVQGVWWFLYWLLRVLVRFFWLFILLAVGVEFYLNWNAGNIASSIVAAVITLLLGLFLWAALFLLVVFLRVSTTISRVVSDVNRIQRDFPYQQTYIYPYRSRESEVVDGKIIEGSITDLDEERRKRRSE